MRRSPDCVQSLLTVRSLGALMGSPHPAHSSGPCFIHQSQPQECQSPALPWINVVTVSQWVKGPPFTVIRQLPHLLNDMIPPISSQFERRVLHVSPQEEVPNRRGPFQ